MLPIFSSSRSERLEILDQREATPSEIDANFREIARVNRYLGGTRAVWGALERLTVSLPPDTPQRLSLLDIATGSGDIPRSIVRRARRRPISGRFRLSVTATDINSVILQHSRRLTSANEFPEIVIEAADALALPYATGSFDIAICSMALHHFAPEPATRLMLEMARVSRIGFIINDLRRNRLAYFLISVLTRLLHTDELTRHDAPLSVLRAYTVPEMCALAVDAGLLNKVQVYAAPMFRAVLIARHRNPTETRELLGIDHSWQ